MKKPLKISLFLIIVIAAIFGLSNMNSNSAQNTVKPTIKIGVTLPLTGDIAMLGESTKQAIQLAVSELKNTKYNYELIIEDDGFKPAQAASTFSKLVNVDKVNALISFGSPVGVVVSDLAEKAQVPHVNDFASDPHVANGAFNFLHYTPAYKDVELFIEQLHKRNIKNIVIFAQQDNPGALALSSALESATPKTDIKIVATQKYVGNVRDFKTLISQTKDHAVDAYVLEGTSPSIEIITKQIREAGIKTPITSMEAFEFSDQLSLFEGMWYVNAADPTKEFMESFKSTYGSYPKFGSANGYDAVNLIVQAVESVGDGKTVPTNIQIRDAIANTKNFKSALGGYLQLDAEGMVLSEPVVRMIKDGKSMTIGE